MNFADSPFPKTFVTATRVKLLNQSYSLVKKITIQNDIAALLYKYFLTDLRASQRILVKYKHNTYLVAKSVPE